MSDVWRELEERLKQKAKTLAQIEDMRDSEVNKVASAPAIYNEMMLKWMLSKWIRLEDVKEAIQQLRQQISNILKWIDAQLDYNPELNDYFKGYKQALTEVKKRLEELLRKNEG